MKLKTLKEVVRDSWEDNGGIIPEDLKQEAINWIKELKSKLNKNEGYYSYEGINLRNDEHFSDISGVEIWVKHFFNITEEDLK